jgi:hypothetical protein
MDAGDARYSQGPLISVYNPIGGGAGDYGFYDPNDIMGDLALFLETMQDGGTPERGSTYDPNAWMSDFATNWGSIQGMVGDYTKGLEESLFSNASVAAKGASETAAGNFSGQGMSGAMGAAIGQASAQPFAEASSRLAEISSGLMGSLGGQAMSTGAASQQYADQSGLGWATLGSQEQQSYLQSLLSGYLGMGELGTSVVAPTYAEDWEGSGSWLKKMFG